MFDPISIASLITLLLAAALFGYVIGVEHGIEEERRNQERHRR